MSHWYSGATAVYGMARRMVGELRGKAVEGHEHKLGGLVGGELRWRLDYRLIELIDPESGAKGQTKGSAKR